MKAPKTQTIGFNRMFMKFAEIVVPLHRQKEYIKGQERIGRASHGCLSIFVD